jgi:hypothetical protein
MISGVVAQSMTFEDFAEMLYSDGWLPTYFDERYWEGGLDTDACFELLVSFAASDGIEVVDLDSVDYASLLSSWYRDTEKGLS